MKNIFNYSSTNLTYVRGNELDSRKSAQMKTAESDPVIPGTLIRIPFVQDLNLAGHHFVCVLSKQQKQQNPWQIKPFS